MPRSPVDHPLASGCLAAVGMPVACGGVLLLVQAGIGHSPGLTRAAGFAAAAAGLLLIGLATRSVRAGRVEAALRAEHPSAPWRWRPEWVDGVIPARRRRWRALAWLLGTGLATLTLLRLDAGHADGARLAIAGAAAALALVSARIWRSAGHGRPALRLVTFPGVLGERLRATIDMTAPPEGAVVRLRCLQEPAAPTLGRRRTAIVHWSHEQRLPAPPAAPGAGVAIDLPLPVSAPISAHDVRWELELAWVAGRPRVEIWDIPVFASVDPDG